jgi:hypothetical protein
MDTSIVHATLKMLKQGQEHQFTPKHGAYYHYARSFRITSGKERLFKAILWTLRAAFYGGLLFILIKILQ